MVEQPPNHVPLGSAILMLVTRLLNEVLQSIKLTMAVSLNVYVVLVLSAVWGFADSVWNG